MSKPHKTTADQVLRAAIDASYLADETETIKALAASCDGLQYSVSREQAQRLINHSRELNHAPLLTHFMHEFSLSSAEGIALMCLAEALLRTPDPATQSRLIRDKLSVADWQQHIGHSPSLMVNASAWGLLLSGKLLSEDYRKQLDNGQLLKAMFQRLGEPAIRSAMQQAMRLLAKQFVAGETLQQAIQTCRELATPNSAYSFDMLGEAAICAADAQHYLSRYRSALIQLGEHKSQQPNGISQRISIKLSALHPRFEPSQGLRVKNELIPKLIELAQLAKQFDIALTIDAEEASRLELSLDCFHAVFTHPTLKNWHGLGLAVQAYQKRALPVLHWLRQLASSQQKVIPLRLVKGAYWDNEIKFAQSQGLAGYPVFSRKQASDISYLACARYLLAHTAAFFPQFASHNALTIASIQQLAKPTQDYEFQRLYGMGENLYRAYQAQQQPKNCCVYVPVGRHIELLPYLVRRMLENGANTSFVYQTGNPEVAIETLLADPFADIKRCHFSPHPAIALPSQIYPARKNSSGINFDSPSELNDTLRELSRAAKTEYIAEALLHNTPARQGRGRDISSPADQRNIIGQVYDTPPSLISRVIDDAARAQTAWAQTPVNKRAEILEVAANLFEEHQSTLSYLCIHEAGRCLRDAQAEIRETVDFCRYYAQQARQLFNTEQTFQGIVGEQNKGLWRGRGVFLCISPWNFPLAIFTGQVVAALVAGNSVIAKPASATPLCGMQIIKYLQQAGVPSDVLQFVPGPSELLGQQLNSDVRISGLAFTGSINTAQRINRQLAARDAPLASVIAETGGQNVMIADSSALAEQLVKDVIRSAFNSAGQRCSALRVLFIAEEIADDTVTLLKGAMQQLSIGDPSDESVDIGPLIDRQAVEKLERHIEYLSSIQAPVFQLALTEKTAHGHFFPATLCELENIQQLPEEVFGPVLHLIRYRHEQLEQLIDSINGMGYGLTLGIHSRIQTTIDQVCQRAKVGNIYINRDMIAAAVGNQPFGGCGLSGTGPKAGGPHYLSRFATELTISENTAAIGGNASLLMLDEQQ
ncbi:MAG: bifunctional proline dehydrogenase/L-glutamate gamma-semialdehyde dehydrogenase PutA [Cycloclasticus sp.]